MSGFFSVAFFCSVFSPTNGLTAETAPRLNASANLTSPATAGYFTLEWTAGESNGEPPARVEWVLERAADERFENPRVAYTGFDTSSTRSGLADGVYYYRVRRSGRSPAIHSPVVAVRVEHHSLARAFAFLGTGLLVFMCSLAVILLGVREERKAAGA